ncbi:MAG: bifunctional (p)ppGpp synthetase/guanosine-3',5'-bis(diphosphate) 3'-pyrophosphohydrolase [Candidatus Sericytochromatia bacterium]|nr:bifunctional (p)ppGpp synthetase/guanosine-3',5'-bis(diphosphate) 3'-pyrophosphohydrolase [Candidatus Tanganyikabacteria bacterium]
MPDELIKTLCAYAPPADVELCRRAYEFARDQHDGQTRKSQEPYIIHPYEVALILARLEADGATVAAGLLHDVLEDTPVPPEDLEARFGQEVRVLVEGVTKLGKLSFSSKQERQAENFRRMFMAMAQDIRVIVVKLADRLHNMRTLEHMAPHKQVEIAQETLDIFAPLAHRLGMGRIKWELEDLALQYLHPQEYEQIRSLIAEKREERERYIAEICEAIQSEMDAAGVKGKVFGRPKHFYSVYNKMKSQGKAFTDLFDLTALRVLVDSIPDCYHVLGIVHNLWRPIPGRIKDYIAMPKPNLYQSLHTSVMGPRGKPFEIQIRTTEMNQIAEYGIAAHWRYKEGGDLTKADEKLTWLRQILELKSDMKDPEEFLTSVKEDLFSDEVFVFTPRGDVLDLKRGATVIDFAYRIHSSVGHRCTGAKVNGRIVPLDTTLGNGDIIEIMTSKVEKPSLDWLSFVTTTSAKQRIRSWFKRQRREENIELGREALERELDRMRLLNLAKPEYLSEIAPKLKFQSADDVLAAIGYGEKPAVSVANLLRDTYQKPLEPFVPKTHVPAAASKRRNGTGILVEGDSGMLLHLSKCCSPVPGEPIVGLVTKTRGISIHAADCPNLAAAEGDRRVSVDWPGGDQSTFPVEIAIEVIDRVGLLKDVTAKMADTKTNIRNVEVRQSGKGKIVVVHLVIDVFDLDHLQRVLGVVGRIADVIRAYRVARGQRVRR